MPSLFPERAISFSPSLAATIGLEEAVMLQGLQEVAQHAASPLCDGALQWQHTDHKALGRLFPFWDANDIERVSKSLVDKGLLLLNSAAYSQVKHLYFALNDGAPSTHTVSSEPQHQQASAPVAREAGKTAIQTDWQPDPHTRRQLQQHGVSNEFIEQQLPEFVLYWQQRGETAYAWGSKFLKHVVHAWRRHQADINAADSLSRQWSPSEDAMEILLRIDISRQFIEDTIPEFVLYWRERGDGAGTWNSKFIAHVKKQWAYYTAALENNHQPSPLPANWQPSQDVYDILAMANIDTGFARSLLAEFKLFWLDNGQAATSWNTKFLQHVKYQWARKHQFESTAGTDYANQPATHRPAAVRADKKASAFERLTDRSWASGL